MRTIQLKPVRSRRNPHYLLRHEPGPQRGITAPCRAAGGFGGARRGPCDRGGGWCRVADRPLSERDRPQLCRGRNIRRHALGNDGVLRAVWIGSQRTTAQPVPPVGSGGDFPADRRDLHSRRRGLWQRRRACPATERGVDDRSGQCVADAGRSAPTGEIVPTALSGSGLGDGVRPRFVGQYARANGGAPGCGGLILHCGCDIPSFRIRFQEAIWHGFVLAGAACHYVAIVNATQ